MSRHPWRSWSRQPTHARPPQWVGCLCKTKRNPRAAEASNNTSCSHRMAVHSVSIGVEHSTLTARCSAPQAHFAFRIAHSASNSELRTLSCELRVASCELPASVHRASQHQLGCGLRSALDLSSSTSPLSMGGHGWVGGTVCCHGWQHTSLHGRTCSGSRQPTRACPARHGPAVRLLPRRCSCSCSFCCHCHCHCNCN